MSRRRGWVALFLFSLALINYIDRTALSFASGSIRHEYNLSPVQLGYLFSSFLWTYTIFLLPMGSLVDRFGPKRVAGGGITIWSLATAAAGLAWSFPSLLASLFVMGAGEAASNPVGGRVIREWIPAGERGTLSAVFNSGSYAGPALCAVAAGPIITVLGWRALFYVAGGVGLVWMALWMVFYTSPEEARWLGEAERQKIIAERGAKTADFDAPKAGLLRLLSSGTTLWGQALAQGCAVYSQYLFLTWLPSYLQATKGLTIGKTGLLAAVPYSIAVVLVIFVGLTNDRLLRGNVKGGKRRNMIACAMMLSSTILLTPFIENTWVILGLFGLALTGIASTTSLNYALLNDLLRSPQDIGVAMAFLIVGGNTFGLLAPIVTGHVISLTGSYNAAFVIAGVLLVLGAAIILTMTRRPIVGYSDEGAVATVCRT